MGGGLESILLGTIQRARQECQGPRPVVAMEKAVETGVDLRHILPGAKLTGLWLQMGRGR